VPFDGSGCLIETVVVVVTESCLDIGALESWGSAATATRGGAVVVLACAGDSDGALDFIGSFLRNWPDDFHNLGKEKPSAIAAATTTRKRKPGVRKRFSDADRPGFTGLRVMGV
jgi:hypothetical protein